MALYIPHSIFHLARLLYVRRETFGPYYVYNSNHWYLKGYYIIIQSSVVWVTGNVLKQTIIQK